MNILDVLKKPQSWFENDDSDEKVVGAFRRAFNTSEGEIVLKHLIQYSEIGTPKGALSSEESSYYDGRADAVLYIIGLTSTE